MAWQIIGHEWAVTLLRRGLETGRVAHATLLCGPPQIGKTRLALRLAEELAGAQPAAFEHGIFFVPLAPFRTAEGVVPAVAEALGVIPAYEKMLEVPGATVIANEPTLQLALDDDCRIQCRFSIETRTSAYNVRTGDYPEEQLSVYLTARRYGSLDPGESFGQAMERLSEICRDMVDGYLVDQVLRPLQQAIAIK